MNNTVLEQTRNRGLLNGEKGHFFSRPDSRHTKQFCTFAAQTLNSSVMTAAELNELWMYLQGLNLSADERLWLSERLVRDSNVAAPSQSEKRTALQWFREHQLEPNETGWDCQSAWNNLSLDNREVARKLNLSPDDIDERTFNILSK